MRSSYVTSFFLNVMLLLTPGCVILGGGQVVTKGSFVYVNADFASTPGAIEKRAQSLRANGTKMPSENLSGVKIFYKQDVPQGSKDVAIIEAFGRGYSVSLQDLYTELQTQAYLAGANGIREIEPTRFDETGSSMHATAIAILINNN